MTEASDSFVPSHASIRLRQDPPYPGHSAMLDSTTATRVERSIRRRISTGWGNLNYQTGENSVALYEYQTFVAMQLLEMVGAPGGELELEPLGSLLTDPGVSRTPLAPLLLGARGDQQRCDLTSLAVSGHLQRVTPFSLGELTSAPPAISRLTTSPLFEKIARAMASDCSLDAWVLPSAMPCGARSSSINDGTRDEDLVLRSICT